MSIARRTLLTGGLALIGSGRSLFAGEPRFPETAWDAPGPNPTKGWSSEGLRTAEELFEATKPTAVMVVHDGRVVAAWGDVARTVNVRSVRKSVLSALYGIGVAEGRIDLNRTLAELGIHDNEPRLTAAEREATIRDLLMSRSGVYHGAVYEAPGMAAARPPRGSHTGRVLVLQQLGLQRPRHDLYAVDRREHLRGIRAADRAPDWDGGLPGQQGRPTRL
jgi:CubicO group peptidase (beta-lactamase class C family)